jgi:hypothetical protein
MCGTNFTEHPVKQRTLIIVIKFYKVCKTANEDDDENNNKTKDKKCGHSGLNALTI